jgi:hypothetical protein
MRLLKLVLVGACVFGAWHWWDGKRRHDLDDSAMREGFVAVQMPDGAAANTVLVLAPPNCPSDEARRAEALVDAMREQGIPVAKGSSMSFEIRNPTSEQREGVDRAVAVFNRGAPAVFVNGRGMSDPTAAQVAAEYRRTRGGL